MDTYTLMCSLCEPLQEACPKEVGKSIPIFMGLYYDEGDVFFFDKDTNSYWLPSLEQLIGMLEEINILWEIRKEFATTHKNSIEYWYCAINCNNEYTGNTHKIAILKLVAFELWHKTWKGEKWV